MISRRDAKLDTHVNKRVSITILNTEYSGLLTFDDTYNEYVLKNCIDIKRGFPIGNIHFRKSHVKSIKEMQI